MYTQCKLTVSSNKVVAISGLASDIRRVLHETWPEKKHRYWVGLWEEDLRTGSCWAASGDKKRQLSHLAPSWSWASIDGMTHVPYPAKALGEYWFLSEGDCGVHTEDIGQEGNDNSKLLLELTGPCAIINTHDFGPIKTEPGYREVRCFTDCGSGAELTMPATTLGVYSSEPHVMFDEEEDMPEKALCMPINTARRYANHSGYFLKGLVFSEVIGTGRYRRVGYLEAVNLATKDAVVNLFEPLQRKTITTYSTTQPANRPNPPKSLGTTNTTYASLDLFLSNKEPIYVVLASNLEDVSVSFLHVRALCLVSLQFLQRYRAS
jgi:hypothetical protein